MGVKVLGETGDAGEVRRLTRELRPDLVFMDIAMPGMNEFEVLHESTKQFPEVRIIILDAGQDGEGASQALSAGATGYLSENANSTELVDAIATVSRGKDYQRRYDKRKAAGLCGATGCARKPDSGYAHCRRHLQYMSVRNKNRYHERSRVALCIYCGKRPRFWGVRCVICRQRFAKHPLPFGARRALRLYREAEKRREAEQIEVEARYAVRKLLASGVINANAAKALRLYAGTDNGKWRTYSEVGQLMKISKERVRKLLLPSKVALSLTLGDRVPWRSWTAEDLERNGNRSLAPASK